MDRERAEVLAGVHEEVAALAADPTTSDYADRIDAIASIPEQIVDFLAERLEQGIPEYEPLLEVMVKRHYLEFDLHGLHSLQAGGRTVAVADYSLEGQPTRIVATLGQRAELDDPASALNVMLAEQVAARDVGDDAVVEIYTSWPEAPEDVEAASAELRGAVAVLPWAREVRRVALAVSSGPGANGAGRPVTYFTFRWLDGHLTEDARVRGVHPMVGRRLNLWRLREFDVTRIEAPDDVLLYECVAKSNPADRRLVAVAQVRQLAVVRDEDGTVLGLPHAERAVENCLEAIRRARTSRGESGRGLDMNHVWVQVWPLVEADLDQLTALQRKITPLSDGAGIEEVLAQGRIAAPDGSIVPIAIRFHSRPGAGVVAEVVPPPTQPLKPLDEYAGKVLRARRRGLVYPYELADCARR